MIILVRGDLQNKEMICDTWAPIASMTSMKYLLAYSIKHKEILHQLDFIGSFLQSNTKHRVVVKFDSIYGEYFPEYANYFGRPLRLNKPIYGMTVSGKLFYDELANWLIDKPGSNQHKCQMSVYHKYAPDGSKLFVLYYVNDCLYWYTSE